jgi:hypothetical protein
MLKTLATALNKSKKKKRFFLLDLKRSYIARVTSVASAERDATLMEPDKARIRARIMPNG